MNTADMPLTTDLCIAFIHACIGANLRASMGYDNDAYVLYVHNPIQEGLMTCTTAYDVGQAIKVYTQYAVVKEQE